MANNGFKNLTQMVDSDGIAFPAEGSPDYFLVNDNIYAPLRNNNKVQFFTTGVNYYTRLGEIIDKATKSVFITGWQVNYDIILDKGDNPNGSTDRAREQIAQKEQELVEYKRRLENAEQLAANTDTSPVQKRIIQANIPLIKDDIEFCNTQLRMLNQQVASSKVDRTLWQCLHKAVKRGVKVYVMPWMSPPFPTDIYTRCYETMLAMFQLNSGLPEQRAFCIPSWELSDMGVAGSFFSHHQKSVIVDNNIAFVGGLDLAYGRRDDEMFRLNCSNRKGEDRYNNCIPAVDEATTDDAVTVIGLMLSTFFDTNTPARFVNAYATVANVGTRITNWWSTPMSNTPYLWLKEIIGSSRDLMNEVIDDAMKEFLKIMLLLMKLAYQQQQNINNGISHAVSSTLSPASISSNAFTGSAVAAMAGAIAAPNIGAAASRVVSHRATKVTNTNTNNNQTSITGETNNSTSTTRSSTATTTNQTTTEFNAATLAKLQNIWQKIGNNTVTSQDYVDILPLVLDWIQTADYAQYAAILVNMGGTYAPKEEQLAKVKQLMQTLLWYVYSVFQRRAMQQNQPYHYIAKVPQPLFPKSGKKLKADSQPRMPWHDVHLEVQGEAVYDLARNFIERWNSTQQWIESVKRPADLEIVQTVMTWAACLYEDGVNQTIKDMLAWTSDQFNQSSLVQTIKTELSFEPPAPQYIAGDLLPPEASQIKAEEGQDALVQIIRSAPATMLAAERAAEQSAYGYTRDSNVRMGTGPNKTHVSKTQDNCQQAWIKAIEGSLHFLYIETQFFQSVFGNEFGYLRSQPPTYSGPMNNIENIDPKYVHYLRQINFEQAILQLDYKLIDWEKLAEIGVDNRKENIVNNIMSEIIKAFKARLTGEVSNFLFNPVAGPDPKLKNKILEAIVKRITRAVQEKRPYHVYLVVPVHPEGPLNSNTLMHQVHLTMQTISFGKQSLIKSIQRAVYIQKQIDIRKAVTEEEKRAIYNEISSQEANPEIKPDYINEKGWTEYLTLLNLRSWETLNGMPATEQIYIHSKLIIADDNVAVIGSCNVNDRSMTGDRDSELAAIVRGKDSEIITINGTNRFAVSKVVHEFRVNLWKKIFGLNMSQRHPSIQPARSLEGLLSQPAAPRTWREIQKVANSNANKYNTAFQFIPQNISQVQVGDKQQEIPDGCDPDYPKPSQKFYPLRCSIWPTWVYNNANEFRESGELATVMPFHPDFWLNPRLNNYTQLHAHDDPWYRKVINTFSAKKFPQGVEGFIVALPHEWTMGENNTSKIHIYAVADNRIPNPYDDVFGTAFASLPPQKEYPDA